MKRTTRLLATATLTFGIGVGTLAVGTGTAHAGSDWGVKSIHFEPADDFCTDDPALPCTTNAGVGNANRLIVRQREAIDTGEVSFNDVETTADDPDDLWMAATVGAECRDYYKLFNAMVRPGLEDHTSSAGVAEEVDADPAWDGVTISVPNAKTMPNKKVALNLPLDEVFDGADPMTTDFPTLADVYAYGEYRIDLRMDQGMSEAEARADDFSVLTYVELHTRVTCKHNTWHRYRTDRQSKLIPLIIEFEPYVAAAPTVRPPARDQAVGDSLAIPEGVTAAALSVIPDPADPCTLHLSGTITSAVDTTVTYRFVDEYGQLSNGFQVEVQADVPEFVVHQVAVPGADDDPAPGGFFAPAPDHQIGGYSIGDHAGVTGTYQLRVESPNLLLSNVDGFNVAPCPAG